jgi:hypothetical protein
VTEGERLAIIAEILELDEVPPRESGDFSAPEYLALSKTLATEAGARHRLRRLVTKGVLETGLRFDTRTHRPVRVWWKA